MLSLVLAACVTALPPSPVAQDTGTVNKVTLSFQL